MSELRILFVSCHAIVDPSSGAALATRDLMELLAARGSKCRALTAGSLDFEEETRLESALELADVPYRRARATLDNGEFVEVVDLELHGVRVTSMPTASSRPDQISAEEQRRFFHLVRQGVHKFRPNIILTYGGQDVQRRIRELARRLSIKVVFGLHNLEYQSRDCFDDVDAIFVPSQYARRWYLRQLGIVAEAIPPPVRRKRVVASDREPQYVTFVNPSRPKGSEIFARIASELSRRRPDIPLLVVESRGRAQGLASSGVDLSRAENLFRMDITPDPRHFYRVTKILLMPSVQGESFGRVAAEGLANGIPVLATDRGALPETLGEAGFVFTPPDRCFPPIWSPPTPQEVSPWVETILRLWDDEDWASKHRQLAFEAAMRWDADRQAVAHEEFFRRVSSGGGDSHDCGSAC